jgi:hypothetical protein
MRKDALDRKAKASWELRFWSYWDEMVCTFNLEAFPRSNEADANEPLVARAAGRAL